MPFLVLYFTDSKDCQLDILTDWLNVGCLHQLTECGLSLLSPPQMRTPRPQRFVLYRKQTTRHARTWLSISMQFWFSQYFNRRMCRESAGTVSLHWPLARRQTARPLRHELNTTWVRPNYDSICTASKGFLVVFEKQLGHILCLHYDGTWPV